MGRSLSDAEKLAAARALLDRVVAGFSAYIHGRKLTQRERDRLLADIRAWLM